MSRRATNDGTKRVEVSACVSPARGKSDNWEACTRRIRVRRQSRERANTVGMDSAEDKRVLCAAG